MKNPLSKLPFPVEFAVIVIGAFGYSVFDGVQGLLQHHGGGDPTNAEVWWEAAIEAGTVLVLGLFLWGRRWNFKRLGMETDWRDGPWALALAAGVILAANLLAILTAGLSPGEAAEAAKAPVQTLSLVPVGALVLINGVYEELFAAGYVIAVFKEKGQAELGLNLSIAIRVLVHIFQGVTGVIVMVPLGLIFGFWYLRTGRLWPLILAHTILIAWSYAPYVKL